MNVQEFVDTLDADEIAERIAPYGDTERGVRSSRPTDESGLVQYIWRMVRFHMGEDTHMPVTCSGWLTRYMENKGLIPERADRSLDFDDPERRRIMKKRRETQRELEDALEDVITDVIHEFDGDPAAAAKRWHRAGLF